MICERLVRVALLLLFSLTPAFVLAEEPAAAASEAPAPSKKSVDPTGAWRWEYRFNDNEPAEFSLKLKWDGKELTGKYTAFDATTDIEEGKVEDGKLSFISKRTLNNNEFTVHFQGKAEADDIVGTVAVDFGEGPREFDWHAERTVDVDGILGSWKLNLETPQGVIQPVITIKEEKGKLTGHYVSPFGEREAKELTFKAGELAWRIESEDDDDLQFEVEYRGKIDGDKISGSTEYDFDGNAGSMEFTGERTPPEPKAESKSESAPETEAAQTDTATPAAAASEKR
jgi:hypothetical protein